jgi:aquaporin Z
MTQSRVPHLAEYASEFFGTALMMAIGVGAITLMWSSGSPMREVIHSDGLRRLVTGIMFAGGATLVVLSPLGQRSGGHLNPAVTLAFWWKGQITTPDALAYVVAQILGALLGVGVIVAAAGSAAKTVQYGMTAPGQGFSVATVFAAEILITFLLVFLILYSVNNQRFAPKTPYLAGSLVALLVFVEAPISGTSLNPARSLAPAVLMNSFQDQWLYWIAPLVGALIAVKLFGALFAKSEQSGCAKLYHTERYRCIFLNCGYKNVTAGTVVMRQGEAASAAYVIERGELEVRMQTAAGDEVVLAHLHPGDWVGEMALLLELPRSATVVAAKDSELRMVTAHNLAHVIAEHPSETARLLKQMTARLHEANLRLGLPLTMHAGSPDSEHAATN